MAEYYYLDADGQTVHGPCTFDGMVALRDRQLIGAATQVCLPGTQTWLPFYRFPELQAQIAAPVRDAAPAPRATQVGPALAIFIIILAVFGCIGLYIYGAHTVASGHRPFWQSAPTSFHYVVHVRGTTGLPFQGSVGVDAESRTVQDRVPADFDFQGRVCVAVLQKVASSGALEVTIDRDLESVGNQTTSAPFGVVTVATR